MGFRALASSVVPRNWRGSPLAVPYSLIFLLSFVPPVVEFVLVQTGLAPRVPSAAVTPWAPVTVTHVFEPSPLRVGDVLLSVDGASLAVGKKPLRSRGANLEAGEYFHLRVLRDGATLDIDAPAMVPRFSREQVPFALIALVVLATGGVLLFLCSPSVKALAVLLAVPFSSRRKAADPTLNGTPSGASFSGFCISGRTTRGCAM